MTRTKALTSELILTFPPGSTDAQKPQRFYQTTNLPIRPGRTWALRIALSGDIEFRWKVLAALRQLQERAQKLLPVVIVENNETPDFTLSPDPNYDYRFEASSWNHFPQLKSKRSYSNTESLGDVVYGGAVYYWFFHLSRESVGVPETEWPVGLEWFDSASEDFKNLLKSNHEPPHEPTYEIGPVDVSRGYSFTITNRVKTEIWVQVFLFDATDHAICALSFLCLEIESNVDMMF